MYLYSLVDDSELIQRTPLYQVLDIGRLDNNLQCAPFSSSLLPPPSRVTFFPG